MGGNTSFGHSMTAPFADAIRKRGETGMGILNIKVIVDLLKADAGNKTL